MNEIIGETIIYGKVDYHWMFGIYSYAKIELIEGGSVQVKAHPFESQILRYNGKRIGLTGIATWIDKKIVKFVIESVLTYEECTITEAFDELKKVSGGFWDGVDVIKIMEELRGEGE